MSGLDADGFQWLRAGLTDLLRVVIQHAGVVTMRVLVLQRAFELGYCSVPHSHRPGPHYAENQAASDNCANQARNEGLANTICHVITQRESSHVRAESGLVWHAAPTAQCTPPDLAPAKHGLLDRSEERAHLSLVRGVRAVRVRAQRRGQRVPHQPGCDARVVVAHRPDRKSVV